jgi:hypothetical protein
MCKKCQDYNHNRADKAVWDTLKGRINTAIIYQNLQTKVLVLDLEKDAQIDHTITPKHFIGGFAVIPYEGFIVLGFTSYAFTVEHYTDAQQAINRAIKLHKSST